MMMEVNSSCSVSCTQQQYGHSLIRVCLSHTHTMQLLEVILIRKWRFLRSQAPTGSYVILPDKKQSSHFGMQLMFILVINSPMSLTSNARAACQRKHGDYQRVISFWLKFIFTCRHISTFYENAKKSFDGLFFEFSCKFLFNLSNSFAFSM